MSLLPKMSLACSLVALASCAELRQLGHQPQPGGSQSGAVFQAPLISQAGSTNVPVQVFQVEKPVASPSLVPVPTTERVGQPSNLDPRQAVREAVSGATQSSDAQLFDRAMHSFLFFENSVYEVFFSPGFLTTLYLQPGEELINFFAGDTSRWSITQTHTGSADEERILVLVKPHVASIRTNFVISTNKRVYLVDAVATGEDVYHTAVAWNYPSDNLNSLRPVLSGTPGRSRATTPVPQVVTDPARFAYDYRIELIEGDEPVWKPVGVFSDGNKTYIRFPNNLGAVDAPPLFIIGAEEENGLVNYRVDRNFYVVDRPIERAVLQHGDPRSIIMIERLGG